jgi:hypothetical protein
LSFLSIFAGLPRRPRPGSASYRKSVGFPQLHVWQLC